MRLRLLAAVIVSIVGPFPSFAQRQQFAPAEQVLPPAGVIEDSPWGPGAPADTFAAWPGTLQPAAPMPPQVVIEYVNPTIVVTPSEWRSATQTSIPMTPGMIRDMRERMQGMRAETHDHCRDHLCDRPATR